MKSPVDVEDSVRTPVAPSPERLRDFYFAATERLTLGLVRYVDHSFQLGSLTLVRLGGLTAGGLLLRQRVVAVDGGPVTPGQALLRLAALPLSWLRLRAVHDEIAGTDVVRP